MLIIVILIAPIVIKVITVTILYVFDPVILTHLVCYPYTHPSWDHAENEDKHLISHVPSMNPQELKNSDLAISKNHISNVSNTILNLSENRVSSLSISYIEYFYHVFPLHLNSFNRLFSDVINLKLHILKSSVGQFTTLTSEITTYVSSLTSLIKTKIFNVDFASLAKFLPSESTIKPDIESIKGQLNKIVSQFEITRLSHSFNTIVEFITRTLNVNLKALFDDFKNEVKKHKASLEGNIKSYIGGITKLLCTYRTEVFNLIKTIENNITTLNRINGKIRMLDQFDTVFKIINYGIEFDFTDISKFTKLFETQQSILHCFITQYSTIKKELKKFKKYLNLIKNIVHHEHNTLSPYKSVLPSTNLIQDKLFYFQYFKMYGFKKVDNHLTCVKKLEEIGSKIKDIKEYLKSIKNILQKNLVKHIHRLNDINIKERDIKDKIQEIKGMNNSVIVKLKIAKHTIEFYNSLKNELEELNKLNSLNFTSNNFTEFLKNSFQIKKKLTSFESSIKSQIQKLEGSYKSIPNHKVVVEGEVYKESNYTSELPKIKTFIDNALIETSILRYIVYHLLIIKFNFRIIDEVKIEINKINDLDNAVTNLESIYYEILKFYYLQFKSTFLLNYYSLHLESGGKFKTYLKKLNEIIVETRYIIYLIPLYYTILYPIKEIVKNMQSLKPKIEALNQFKENGRYIKAFIRIIINQLNGLNCNIRQLNCDMSDISVNNVKDKIMKLKNQIPVIKENIECLIKTLEYTKTYIEKTVKDLKEKCKEITKEIQKSIDYLATIIFIQNLMSIPNYLVDKNYENPVVVAFRPIVKYLNQMKSHIELNVRNLNLLNNYILLIIFDLKILIKNIESELNNMESKVIDLECAIEGVVKNTILCSLKSLSIHLTNSNNFNRGLSENNLVKNPVFINLSIVNVTNYNVVLNILFQSAKKIDQILELIRWTYGCKCISSLESKNTISLYDINVKFLIDNLSTKPNDEFNKSSKLENIKKIQGLQMDGNHLCLCMINKYILYPATVKLMYLLVTDLNMLSTLSRKYDKYMNYTNFNMNISQMLMLAVEIVNYITSWISKNYYIEWTGYSDRVEIKCNCKYYQDRYYPYLISIILFVSSLIENIWPADKNSIVSSIQSLSSLLSEFDTRLYNSNSSKNLNIHITGDYNVVIKQNGNENGSHTMKCSQTISCNNNNLIYNQIYLKFFEFLTCKMKGKDRLNTHYESCCTLAFQLNINGTVIKKTINILFTNHFIAKLHEICSNTKCTAHHSCKCGRIKMSIMDLLLRFTYSKIISKINLTKELLSIMSEINGKNYDEFSKIIRSIGKINLYIIYLLKNSYSAHFNTYTDHKNIANSFPSLTMGYGYESVY